MLAAGDLILLIDKVGRRYRVRLAAGEQFSMHAGAIAHDDLIGRPEGVVVATQRGSRLLAVRPTFAEQVTGRRRQAQPIYPKDLGAILVGADIFPGARVLEAGTGTGKGMAYLVPAAAGHKLGCFGLTEPMSGSDAQTMNTTASGTNSTNSAAIVTTVRAALKNHRGVRPGSDHASTSV